MHIDKTTETVHKQILQKNQASIQTQLSQNKTNKQKQNNNKQARKQTNKKQRQCCESAR